MTPTNHIVIPKDICVEVLPSNWHQILGRVRKSACTTCCPADPADPSRRIGCNQTDERTWKCNYCHRNNLPCSWAAGKLRCKKNGVLIATKNDTAAAKKGLGQEPPARTTRATHVEVSKQLSMNNEFSVSGEHTRGGLRNSTTTAYLTGDLQRATTSSRPSRARRASGRSGDDTNEVCDYLN